VLAPRSGELMITVPGLAAEALGSFLAARFPGYPRSGLGRQGQKCDRLTNPLWTMVQVGLHYISVCEDGPLPSCWRGQCVANGLPANRKSDSGTIDDRTTHQSSIGGNPRG
jgi:hypothetical protein